MAHDKRTQVFNGIDLALDQGEPEITIHVGLSIPQKGLRLILDAAPPLAVRQLLYV